MAAVDYLDELRSRLANPAILDAELLIYINAAFRDVSASQYSKIDYDAQIIDTACQYLLSDGKFPEVSGISAGGVSTNFTGDGPERFRKRIAGRREAEWIGAH